MRLFALILFAITCIGLVGVGVRSLRAGARTRTLPEIIYGVAYSFLPAAYRRRVEARWQTTTP